MLTALHRPDVSVARAGAKLTRGCGIDTPIGPLSIKEQDGAIVSVAMGRSADDDTSPLLRQAQAEIAAYFAGRLRRFSLPVRPKGSAYQLRAWAKLAAIPYGEVETYGEVARAIGSGPRAVGQACRTNPLLLLVPCHRVVAVNGLGGFSGKAQALEAKRALLALEGRA